MENKNQVFDWMDFLSFRSMISLKIIQILYAIVAVLMTLWSLKLLFLGGDDFDGFGRISGLLLLIFGNVFWRVWCELIIVMFRINKTLNNIDDNTKK
jgi:hypothetical protein